MKQNKKMKMIAINICDAVGEYSNLDDIARDYFFIWERFESVDELEALIGKCNDMNHLLDTFLRYNVRNDNYQKIREAVEFLIQHRKCPSGLYNELKSLLEDLEVVLSEEEEEESNGNQLIQLGHNNPPADEAIDSLEETIRSIKTNNAPVENQEELLAPMEETLESLKNGKASKNMLRGSIDALKKAYEIFIEAGEVAGKITKAIWKIGALAWTLGWLLPL